MKITIETPSILDIRPGVRLSIQPNGVIVIEPEPLQELEQQSAVPPRILPPYEEAPLPKTKSISSPRHTKRPNIAAWSGPKPSKKMEHEAEPVNVFPYVTPRSPESIAIEEKILSELKLQQDVYHWYSFSEILDIVFPDIIRRENGKSTRDYGNISTVIKRLAKSNVLDFQKEGTGWGHKALYRLHKED